MNSPLRPGLTRLAVAVSAALLAGCASFSQDGGLDDVARMAEERIAQPAPLKRDQDSRAEVTALLSKPLTPDAAVRIALLNNHGLQASLAELAIAEADFVQAGRLPNPGFSFGRVRGGAETEIDRRLSFDLAALVTLPARTRIERRRFEQAKLQAAMQAVNLAADTRKAYYSAVAAAQASAFADKVRVSAEAAAELAARMRATGNWSTLDAARERAFYQDALTQQAHARLQATTAREELVRLLGLWGPSLAFTLPDRLPDLPAQPDQPANAEATALSQRLDVLIARQDAHATAQALGLTKTTGFINVFDAGYANKSTTGAPRENGYEVSLELPLFDWGGARVARAQATYMQTVHRTGDIAVKARSEVRQAYASYRTAYDIARHHRDEVVPLRKHIADEVLLRYNGMLASTFELLAESREQLAAVNASIAAQRDFWIAATNLQTAMNAGGNTDARTAQ
ncbi:RND transporter [Massilia sp. Root133]|uniref:TolC family protein n=1 Tax=unclassified Massilia TaxID=2609279 RepID=UPI000701CF49|nr:MULTISPECIES: TolC family protein [unclassified Massilia]KQY00365.1 RND transporter [Massilia sp. Root133]KQZ41528.1 RND transporter [Massilia sp. Root1485]